ncbi:hypothetical protein BVRB_4g093700 [Beta vulgaris subsp. vulgaris]|nr:hypothetical protein BVRB_4g093700 [Beta vulgaris subsp. vulgaris]
MVLDDVIVVEESDEVTDKSSFDDDKYDADKEEDKGEPEDVAHDEEKRLEDEEMRKVHLLEEQGDNAPPIDNNAREDYPAVSSLNVSPKKAGKELQVSAKTPRNVATKKRKEYLSRFTTASDEFPRAPSCFLRLLLAIWNSVF